MSQNVYKLDRMPEDSEPTRASITYLHISEMLAYHTVGSGGH